MWLPRAWNDRGQVAAIMKTNDIYIYWFGLRGHGRRERFQRTRHAGLADLLGVPPQVPPANAEGVAGARDSNPQGTRDLRTRQYLKNLLNLKLF